MKKKLVALLTCSTMLFSSSAVIYADATDDRIAEIEMQIAELQSELQTLRAQKTQESGDTSESEVKVIAEYTLPDSIGWYTRHFIILQNNTNETVEISTSSLAYAEDATMVGAANASFDALGAGCTSVLYEAFETDAKITSYETEISASPSEYYESVIQDLSYVQNDIEDGAVFQVTNNGTDAASFVEGYALYFLGDELVGYESTYFVDDDSEIKPGKTISKQMTSYDDFDRIEFYLSGRK